MSIVTDPIDTVADPSLPEIDASATDRTHQRTAAVVAVIAGGLATVTAVLGLLVLAH